MKKKRSLSVVLAFAMLFGSAAALPQGALSDSVSITASAVMKDGTEGKCGANVKWTCYDGTLTISGTGDMYDYASSEDSPFAERKDIKKIVVKSGVTSIGSYALAYIHQIESVSLPDTLTRIGDYAFHWCRNFKGINIPGSVKKIGTHAFSMCSEFENLTLNEGLQVINDHAFAYCSITSLKLPSTLTDIGEAAFTYCTDIKGTVTIPGSVKSINQNAFYYCKGIEKIVLENGVARILGAAFNGCEKLSSISIPNTVFIIGGGAFTNCQALKSITIPNSVTTIAQSAFRYSGLTSIVIPSSVKSVGNCLFENCKSLKSASLPDGLEKIGVSTFEGCEALTSVKLPSKLKELPERSFYSCKALTSVTIPNTVTGIGNSAFYNCEKLKSVTISSGVTSIGGAAFAYCAAIKTITVPNSVKEIGNGAFEYCRSLLHVYLPNKITAIAPYTFQCCTSLLYVNIPEGVTSIGERAFDCCESLNGLYLPTTVRNIGEMAFYCCPVVKNITIPAAVTAIDSLAFGFTYDEKTRYYKKNPGFSLSVVKGSDGEKYAKTNGIAYEYVPAKTIRMAGKNRYSTAVEISRTGTKTNGSVVLASGNSYPDALAGAAFAKCINAPILLTDKDKISNSVLVEIDRLKASKVYILGGVGAVSTAVEKMLKNRGLKTERVSGDNRFATAVAAAKRTTTAPSELFFVCSDNFADALSVSAVSALKKAPIIYLTKDGALNADTAKYLASVKGKVKNAYIIGGTGVISDAMMKKAASALGLKSGTTVKRICGNNRYTTCAEVNKAFSSLFKGKDICIATGAAFPDALSGGVFAALKGSPLMLAKDTLYSEQISFIKSRKPQKKYVFGGKGAVPNDIVAKIAAAGA